MDRHWDKIAIRAVEEHRAMQKPTELASLLKLIAPRKIHNVLEIGGMYGGTMWCWSQIATGKLVVVDNYTLEGRMETAACEFIHVGADSTKSAARAYVEALMEGERFDFIFVDGDHSYDAVMADAENWMSLASPRGVVAFHDICHRYMEKGDDGYGLHNMWRFWSDLKRNYVSYDIWDPAEEWGGIGVIAMSSFDHLGLRDVLPPFCSPNINPPHCVYPPVSA